MMDLRAPKPTISLRGGVTTMEPFLKKFFPLVLKKMADTKQNVYCIFDSQTVTAFTSSLYIAGLMSSLVAGFVTTAAGRKGTLIIGGVVFVIGAALNAFAMKLEMLILGRLFLGFGIGFANQAAPVYLSEMAPPKWRGSLNTAFQFFLSTGVVLATFINFAVPKKGDIGWRLALGCAAIPAFIMTLGALFIPDTPSSLIQRGKVQEALQSLNQVRSMDSDTETELNQIINTHRVTTEGSHLKLFTRIFQRRYRPHLVLTIVIPTFQQLTGINVIAFYAPVFFRSIGAGSDSALVGAVILGGVNLGSTLVSTYLVDRLGRRFLFLEGGIQISICQVAIACILGVHLGTSGTAPFSNNYLGITILVLMCCISAAFGWSWGPLTWLVPNEILPMEVRTAGQGICIASNFAITFVLAQISLAMLCHLKYGVFLLYAALLVFMTVFVALFVPETKGIHLQSMDTVWRNHWYWHRFVREP